MRQKAPSPQYEDGAFVFSGVPFRALRRDSVICLVSVFLLISDHGYLQGRSRRLRGLRKSFRIIAATTNSLPKNLLHSSFAAWFDAAFFFMPHFPRRHCGERLLRFSRPGLEQESIGIFT